MSATEGVQSQDGDIEVVFRVSKRTHERLMELVRKAEAKDIAEITKNAYRLFEAMVNEAEAGASFFIKRKGDEAPVPYEVFGQG